jgi:hypothetical protein
MSATDSSDVLAGLEAVAEGADSTAESTTASELGAELEAVAATVTTDEGFPAEGTEATSTGRSARDRIQQLVGANNQLNTELDTLRGQQATSQDSINSLTEAINAGRQDTELIQAIRVLNGDPQYSELVQELDRALSGEPPEVDTSEMNDQERAEYAGSLLEDRLIQAEESNAQVATDALLNRADQIADNWLAGLPEDYTERDRKVIGQMWSNSVDWEALEATGDAQAHLEPHLRETLQQAIDVFEQPSGNMVEAGTQEANITELEETQDPVEALQEAIAERQYGEVVTDDVGNSSLAISDDEFTRELAAVMKARQD